MAIDFLIEQIPRLLLAEERAARRLLS